MTKTTKTSKVQNVQNWVTTRIEQQVYTAGQRIPSVRSLAKQLEISAFTVTQAYEQLVNLGRIEARRGAGFFVRSQQTHYAPSSAANTDKPIDTSWLIQHLFGQQHTTSCPGSGILPKEWLRFERLPTLTRQLAGSVHQLAHEQSDLCGYLPLREQYSHLLSSVGVVANSEELLTGEGVSSLLTLVTRYLLSPGDAVVVDNPGWFWLMGNLQAQGFRIFGVQRDAEGPDIKQLRYYFQQEKATLYVTNSVLQNPTGFNIHPARAYQVLNLLHEYDAFILEDDIYRAFDSDSPALRYATLDRSRVFYLTGISKVLGGNWRQGIVCSPPAHHEAIVRQKMLTQMNSAELQERLVYQLLIDASYRKHIGRLRRKISEAHQNLQKILPHYGFRYDSVTQQGLFLWLNTGCDSAELALAAHQAGFLTAPGQLFSPRQTPSTHLRMNVARTDEVFLTWLVDYAQNHRINK